MSPDDLKQTYKAAFGTNEGALVLDDLRQRFHYYNETYVPNSDESAYQAGQRSVLLMIDHIMKDRPKIIEEEPLLNV